MRLCTFDCRMKSTEANDNSLKTNSEILSFISLGIIVNGVRIMLKLKITD